MGVPLSGVAAQAVPTPRGSGARGSSSVSSGSTRQARQKPAPNGVRWMRAAYDLGEAHRVHRLQHVGLGLDDLVLHRVLELLAREPDQAEPEQVVQVGRHLVEVAAPGPGADHRHPRRHQRRADQPDRTAGADVDRGLRSAAQQQQQDPGLVGRELVEDAGVRRMGLALLAPDVARALRAGPRRARAGTSPRPRRPAASRRPARPTTARRSRRAAPSGWAHRPTPLGPRR